MNKTIACLLVVAVARARPVFAAVILKDGIPSPASGATAVVALPKIFAGLNTGHLEKYQEQVYRLTAGIQALSPRDQPASALEAARYLANSLVEGDWAEAPLRAAAAATIVHHMDGKSFGPLPSAHFDSIFPMEYALSGVVRRHMTGGTLDQLTEALDPIRAKLLSPDGTQDRAVMSQILRTLYGEESPATARPVSFKNAVFQSDGFAGPKYAAASRPADGLRQPFYAPTEETVAALRKLRFQPDATSASVDAPREQIPALMTTISEMARLRRSDALRMPVGQEAALISPEILFLRLEEGHRLVETELVRAMSRGHEVMLFVHDQPGFEGAVENVVNKLIEAGKVSFGRLVIKARPGFFVWFVRAAPEPAASRRITTASAPITNLQKYAPGAKTIRRKSRAGQKR